LEQWPLREPFVISRLAPALNAEIIVVEIERDGIVGRGECERSEAIDPALADTLAELRSAIPAVESGISRGDLQKLLPAGCARNAIDCAFFDLEAKASGRPAWEIAGLEAAPNPVATVFTLSLDTPERMAASARAHPDQPILKLKLGRPGDPDRVAAVRKAVPEARICVDANTAWTRAELVDYMPQLAALNVELIEQPFAPGDDGLMDGLERIVPVAADESCLDHSSLPALSGRYDFVNIKLDKTGGLTAALQLLQEAGQAGLGIMVGCNVCTSLSMAPAMLIAQKAVFVDLDGPLLLTRDREHGLNYRDGMVLPPTPALWG
jgi:L-alanine-DL-glutamate epimerase-like enolase superfamily enzyme